MCARRRGFSLVELLVVLSLVAVVTVSVGIRWSDIYQRAKFQSEIVKIADFDFKARRHAASRNIPCRLLFDLEVQTISSSRWAGDREKLVRTKLAEGIRISEIRTLESTNSTGKESLTVSNKGATVTYAIELSRAGDSNWVLFAGRTGQTKMLETTEEIDAAFLSLRSEGVSR